ncbi:MAG: integrase core domain-containing protein [Dietzia sp.]|nr:integrase core domain-containing protein [Dietzia sp.]
MAEITVGSFKRELIHPARPWRDVNQFGLATAEWFRWFKTDRPHECLDDFTPEAVEKVHYDYRRMPPKAMRFNEWRLRPHRTGHGLLVNRCHR